MIEYPASLPIPLPPEPVEQKTGWQWVQIIFIGLALFFVGYAAKILIHLSAKPDSGVLSVSARQGTFVYEIDGRGSVESTNNVTIICDVDGKTTITHLIPEGAWVEKGDIIAQLDTRAIEDRIIWFHGLTENAPAEAERERAELLKNEGNLEEYLYGTIHQDRMLIDNNIVKIEQNVKESQVMSEASTRLLQAGYTTTSQVEVDQVGLQKNINTLKKNVLDRQILIRYSSEKKIVGMVSKIEAARSSLGELSEGLAHIKRIQKRMEEQFELCTVKSPNAGQVVYANQTIRPGLSESEIIQEGAGVKKGQTLFHIPDPSQMQLRALIDESKVLKIKTGMRTVLMFDVDRKRPFLGEVTKVNHFSELDSHSSKKRFAVTIEIADPQQVRDSGIDLRVGLSAEIRIIANEVRDVTLLPLHAIIPSGDKNYVLLQRGNIFEAKEILVGGTNDREAMVLEGLKVSTNVVAGARRYLDEITLPEPEAPSEYGDRVKQVLLTSEPSQEKVDENESSASHQDSEKKGIDNSGNNKPENKSQDKKPQEKKNTNNPKPKKSELPEIVHAGGGTGDSSEEAARSEEEILKEKRQKIEPLQKHFILSTIELCQLFDPDNDGQATRNEIEQMAPDFLPFFDEWDTNRNNILEYLEIAIGYYKVRFSHLEESNAPRQKNPMSIDGGME